MALTQVQAGVLGSDSQYTGFKNRIINGAMMIDQRNAGAAVTINAAPKTYTLDRWQANAQPTAGVFTVQQSSTAPTGFKNSALLTVTTASTPTSGQYYLFCQRVEGFNVADLAWGTLNAATITVSFWVRSSVTGTYSGSIQNNNADRSYPFTYVINSANTFEYKTVVIPGDTTGTWATDNSVGLFLWLDMGCNASVRATAGSWQSGLYYGASGSVQWITNNGATFYITGVQLEKGSTATSFDYRPYGTELALCQRYYQQYLQLGLATYGTTSNYHENPMYFKCSMRSSPTVTVATGATLNYSTMILRYQTTEGFSILLGPSANGMVAIGNGGAYGNWIATAEL